MAAVSLRPILLVEDSPKDMELTLAVFEKSGLANPVVVARDGVEALDYLYRCTSDGAAQPAVVLLDIKMPRVDGLEVLERVRSDATTRHMPVVMLTSSQEEQDRVRSYGLGVNAFVVKPVAYQEFFEAMCSLGVFWAVLNEPPPEPNGTRGT